MQNNRISLSTSRDQILILYLIIVYKPFYYCNVMMYKLSKYSKLKLSMLKLYIICCILVCLEQGKKIFYPPPSERAFIGDRSGARRSICSPDFTVNTLNPLQMYLFIYYKSYSSRQSSVGT